MNIDQMRELVKECGLDWHRGFMPLFDGDETNRYAVLIEESIESSGLQAEVERLTAENAVLRKGMEQQKDTWLSWEGKRRDLEKDAERYRWLLSRIYIDPEQLILRIKDVVVLDANGTLAKKIDAAIEKAMKETP